jgi:hypothetical protein
LNIEPYIETSAKDNINIDELFITMGRKLISQPVKNYYNKNSINLRETRKLRETIKQK